MKFSEFNPADFPELFDVQNDRITYRRVVRQGQPKSYVWTDPEEPVRAWYYYRLIREYNYPLERIDLEVEVYRRTPVDFADIVVYRDDKRSQPFIVVECKAPNASPAVFDQALKQAWGNANNLRSIYACGVDDLQEVCFDAVGFDPKNPFQNMLPLPERYGEPVIFAKRKTAGVDDLLRASQDELNNKFKRCHDILWEGGKRNPAEAFDEMTKLMFSKLQDERIGTPSGQPYRFQIGAGETPSEVAERVRRIWQDYLNVAQPVFQSGITVSDELVYRVVEVLQGYSLSKSDLDAKGQAFEAFLPTVFRGDMGQYFTPRPVVRFMVDLTSPTIQDSVLDPACGSGGFLLYALERMQQIAEDQFNDPLERRDYWVEWAQRGLFGVEVNDQISRVAMMGMILHEDGRTNIACHDALIPFSHAAVAPFYKPESFSVILTNPPFGSSIKRAKAGSPHDTLDAYEVAQDKRSAKTEVLFLERCMKLLKPTGRMAIVLPEGILNNDTTQRLRSLVERHGFVDAVISLPVETFMFSKAFVKSSILLIRKFDKAELARMSASGKNPKVLLDYDIFEAHIDEVGITATGEPGPNLFPQLLSAYREFRKQKPLTLRAAT